MLSLPTTLTPYLFWIKLIGVLLVIAAIGAGGAYVGSSVAHSADAKTLADQVNKTNALQKQYDADKLVWADTKTRMAADAQAVLVAHDQANAAKEAAAQSKITALETKYQTTLKEVQNAKQAALNRVQHPAPGSNDGLWVVVDTSSCASDSDGRDLVSQAASGGHFATTNQCRLSAESAGFLVEAAAQANAVVAAYNECVGSIQVTTAPDPDQAPQISTDTQGATK